MRRLLLLSLSSIAVLLAMSPAYGGMNKKNCWKTKWEWCVGPCGRHGVGLRGPYYKCPDGTYTAGGVSVSEYDIKALRAMGLTDEDIFSLEDGLQD